MSILIRLGDLHLGGRGVPVDDYLAKIMHRGQKLTPDPQQIVLALMRKLDISPGAGMRKEIVAAGK